MKNSEGDDAESVILKSATLSLNTTTSFGKKQENFL